MHVLFVAENPAICEIARMSLEVDGACRATATTSIDRALQVLVNDRPDAAIADALMVPSHRGLVLARTAVDLSVPVLVMTGDAATGKQLEDIGCRYLHWPFRMSELAAELRALMDEGTARLAQLSLQLHRLAANMKEIDAAIAAARETVEDSRRTHAEIARLLDRRR